KAVRTKAENAVLRHCHREKASFCLATTGPLPGARRHNGGFPAALPSHTCRWKRRDGPNRQSPVLRKGKRPRQKKPMPRWSRWILVFVLIIAAGLVAGGFWLASSASPAVGRKVVPGLGGPVEVIRDDRSVPHIFARSEADAVAALGWVH